MAHVLVHIEINIPLGCMLHFSFGHAACGQMPAAYTYVYVHQEIYPHEHTRRCAHNYTIDVVWMRTN